MGTRRGRGTESGFPPPRGDGLPPPATLPPDWLRTGSHPAVTASPHWLQAGSHPTVTVTPHWLQPGSHPTVTASPHWLQTGSHLVPQSLLIGSRQDLTPQSRPLLIGSTLDPALSHSHSSLAPDRIQPQSHNLSRLAPAWIPPHITASPDWLHTRSHPKPESLPTGPGPGPSPTRRDSRLGRDRIPPRSGTTPHWMETGSAPPIQSHSRLDHGRIPSQPRVIPARTGAGSGPGPITPRPDPTPNRTRDLLPAQAEPLLIGPQLAPPDPHPFPLPIGSRLKPASIWSDPQSDPHPFRRSPPPPKVPPDWPGTRSPPAAH
ncbi:WAS/WASL-interacting protein family member 1-like [Haliaeetus albicilla]|uniref:WAS/WASL-interacting protein family member 1-like n=1 Tax=Haliaeetus albicilla TaxID=8969 RepID=UPI0037E81FE2